MGYVHAFSVDYIHTVLNLTLSPILPFLYRNFILNLDSYCMHITHACVVIGL